jgi:cytosine/adenosine deaminase-related metal-dependent hydrolase
MSASSTIAARWVLPIDQPALAPGWIEVRKGRIVRVGSGTAPAGARDLGRVAILPGLINAHTHLELSWLRGKVPPGDSFVSWVRRLLAARGDVVVGAHVRAASMQQAVRELRNSGTVAVGDVSNSLESIPILREAGLAGVVFFELLGFATAEPRGVVDDAWVRLAAAFGPPQPEDRPPLLGRVVAHAPYSVSPELFTEIAARHPAGPLSVHLGESGEELDFLRRGGGPLRTLLRELHVWRNTWAPPACGPCEYLERLGYLQPGTLVVHAVHLTADEIERLRDREAVIVTCPRSNVWVGGGLPPIARFYASGADVAIGTDSLASVASLSLFDELAELRRVAPEVTASSLLESATRVGAKALGIEKDYGTIAPGKRADLVAVDVPEGARDVEEYLVSGVPGSAVRLLDL